MTARWDELKEEPQGLQVDDWCAGCSDSDECLVRPKEKELSFKVIRLPCCHVKMVNGG